MSSPPIYVAWFQFNLKNSFAERYHGMHKNDMSKHSTFDEFFILHENIHFFKLVLTTSTFILQIKFTILKCIWNTISWHLAILRSSKKKYKIYIVNMLERKKMGFKMKIYDLCRIKMLIKCDIYSTCISIFGHVFV